MAQFNIDIPGIGTVTVDGNFATEESINRLAAAMRSRTTGSFDMDDFRDNIDDAADSLDQFDPSIRRNKKSVDDSTKSLNRFSNGFSKVDGLFSDMGDPGSGTLTKLVKTVGEAGAGLGKGLLQLIPVVGDGFATLFTGALGALTGIMTESIAFAQGLVDVNKNINNAGLGMVRGIEDMEAAASSAGIPFQQFTKALLENVDSVRLMTGGVQSGVGLISKSLKKLDREGMQMLYSMGFTVEDIIGTMSDLAANAAMVGKTLTDAELADATDKYLRNQQELARITGVSVKEQKAQMDANRRSVFIQAQLQGLTNEQRTATQGFLNVLKDPGLQEYALKGFTTDRATMSLMQFLPNFGSALQEVTQGVKSGALTQEAAIARYKELVSDPKIAAELADAQRTLGVTIESGMGGAANLASLLGQIQTQLTQQYTQSGAEEAVDYQSRTLEGMNKSVAAMEQLILDVNSGFSTLGFTMFSFVDGYLSPAADGAGSVVDRFQEMSNSLKEYNLARERRIEAEKNGDTELLRELTVKEREAKDKLSSMTGNLVNQSSDILKQFSTEALKIMAMLKDTIAQGIKSGFDYVADTSVGQAIPGYGASTTTQEDMIKKLQSGISPGKLAEENPEQFDQLVNALRSGLRDKIIEEGGIQGSLMALGKYTGIMALGDAIEDIADTSQDNFTTEELLEAYKKVHGKLPEKQALGGIFNYKPGGEIVRVAEAGNEIVAPAKRGADGKLGLEVSGAMLDNSVLLKSLVRINEGQASLIAGLNNKMENMTNSMDRLVNEQRQANRLAV
jgi:hypothetical protein